MNEFIERVSANKFGPELFYTIGSILKFDKRY